MFLSQRQIGRFSLVYMKKVLLALVGAELIYLVLVNGLLRLPLTQDLINGFRPEKFHVSWDSAWTWYPFRVNVSGLSANGESRSQQWQVEASTAAGSVSIVPLLLKRVWVRGVRVSNLDYRQRPRLKADKDYTAVAPFFPSIAGRELGAAETSPRKKKRPWHISIKDARASGEHAFWIYQARGAATGELRADLTFQTRGGPFSLEGRFDQVKLGALTLNEDREVISRGTVSGNVEFAPFIPRENRGAKLLGYLSTDANVGIELNSLEFLNLFLLSIEGMAVDGSGLVKGRLNFHQGEVLQGTDLEIDAQNLSVEVLSHRIQGEGSVGLAMGADRDNDFQLVFRFGDLQIQQEKVQAPLLTGDGLELAVYGNGKVLPDPDNLNFSRTIAFQVSDLAVPDLVQFNQYLPAKWPIALHGGQGLLNGDASISSNKFDLDLRLGSSGADLALRDYRFDTDLDVVLKLSNPDVAAISTSIGGSYVRLDNARLRNSETEQGADSWDASLRIEEGRVGSHRNWADPDPTSTVDLLQDLGKADSRKLLADSYAMLKLQAQMSSLAWLGVLFSEDYQMSVNGAGTLAAQVNIEQGWPAPGTSILVKSEALAVNILDYISEGAGIVGLDVKPGERAPDWHFDMQLEDASFRRINEETAQIHDVNLQLAARIPDVAADSQMKASALAFAIHSATVADMSTYNQYLPEEGPLRFGGGVADLTAAIELQPDDADGWVRLRANDLEAVVGAQSVVGDLAIDLSLVDGTPRDMRFDISGSKLRLDNVRVSGEEAQFEGEYWSAQLDLERGETTWTSPPILDFEASLVISDSRPVVAMFENQGRRPEFLARMLTVEDIRGRTVLELADDKLRIKQAHATSDDIEIAAKGVLSAAQRNAMLYLRYKRADGLLKFHNDNKNLDVIGVKKKFTEFEVP